MSAAAAPPARRLPFGSTVAYGFGAVAYGIKDSGFGTFLLLFYNQVVGLNPGTVGLVIMCALVIDALVDPLVGYLSDNTRSRLGRRYPWMYGAALPIAAAWIALWNPPALSHNGTLIWLFVSAVIVRSAVSCYEVPSQALTPELTSDYDERTRITAWRYLWGWAGGIAFLALAYSYFLAPAPGYPNGLLRYAGYSHMALAAAGVMLFAILASALGTHREIKYLPKPQIAQGRLSDHFHELGETLKNRGFLVLMLAGICAYTNQGISFSLSNYFYSFVWQFGISTLAMLPFMFLIGALIAFLIAPRLGRRWGKPRTATVATLLAMIFQTSPYWLRLLDALPPVGSRSLAPILFSIFILQTAFSVSGFILGASMMADVVEESESRTGRRSEGVFFAGSFFVQKCTGGIGIFVAGVILSVAHFPAIAHPGQVPLATIDRLTLIYIAIYATLGICAALCFTRFPFGRAEHEARLKGFAAAEAEDAPHAVS